MDYMIYDICIIGGGASGMAAAICAGRQHARTILVERMPRPGKKILATGNGRCNLGNLALSGQQPDYSAFYRGNPLFIKDVLSHYDTDAMTRFLASVGIYTHCRGDYIYPMSDQAVSVRNALERAIEETGYVEIAAETAVRKIEVQETEKQGSVFYVYTDKGTCIRARKTILAAGGCAAPKQGSDGSGYRLADMTGHTIIKPLPALTALRCRQAYLKDLAGIRCQAHVALYTENHFLAEDTGEVQLTNYGISGIPVFQVSRYAARELDKGKTVTARIDFFPEISRSRLRSMIQSTASEHPDYTMHEVLSGLMNEKMAAVMARLALHSQKNLAASRWDGKSLALLQELLKCHVLEITDTNGFEQAQVCCGGVDTREINPLTMESKLLKGLYLTGELLDVDGICGGFNLHWAFSTGCKAGQNAAKRRKHA